jgi:hypothetical protein
MKVSDITGRKIMIHEPKSGKDVEAAFMPEHIATRLSAYIAEKGLDPDAGFSISAIRQSETFYQI